MFPLIFPVGPEAEILRLFPVCLSVQTCLLDQVVLPVFRRFLMYRCMPKYPSVLLWGELCLLTPDFLHPVRIPYPVGTRTVLPKLRRPPRTCDLRTTVEVVAARLTSPERVTTGVGASSWAADSEIDSLGSDLV